MKTYPDWYNGKRIIPFPPIPLKELPKHIIPIHTHVSDGKSIERVVVIH